LRTLYEFNGLYHKNPVSREESRKHPSLILRYNKPESD
jgi:hypothetical protein